MKLKEIMKERAIIMDYFAQQLTPGAQDEGC